MRDVLRIARDVLKGAVPALTIAAMFFLEIDGRGIKWSWF